MSLQCKKGSFSIDALLGITAFVFFLLLSIGIFVYQYPAIQLTNEVYALSKIANEQGGLTEQDVIEFKTKINQNFDFISSSSVPITVSLTDESNNNYIGVTPIGDVGDYYLKREDLQIAVLKVTTPSNFDMIEAITFRFGGNATNKGYVFTYPVVSKRY